MDEKNKKTYRINTHTNEKVELIFESIKRNKGIKCQRDIIEYICSYFDGCELNSELIILDYKSEIQRNEYKIEQAKLRIKELEGMIELIKGKKISQE